MGSAADDDDDDNPAGDDDEAGPADPVRDGPCGDWDETGFAINPVEEIGVMTKEEFLAFRRGFVQEYEETTLYEMPYDFDSPAAAGSTVRSTGTPRGWRSRSFHRKSLRVDFDRASELRAVV
ncbi:MAG: hypothetical protein M5R36_09960 [Deltaproteobacteria bacterium]|nr:hypothetical protein [Deltaproteobacteria bacterium]